MSLTAALVEEITHAKVFLLMLIFQDLDRIDFGLRSPFLSGLYQCLSHMTAFLELLLDSFN